MRSLCLAFAAAILAASAASAQAARIDPFPDTGENVHLEMVFNYNMGGDYSPETGWVDLVWGADVPDQPPGMYNSWYIAFDLDDDFSKNNLDWYLQNHPDWLAYKCDKTLAYAGDSKQVPLDFANPDVRAYQWETWIDPKLDQGYRSIAVDRLALANGQNRCGHYAKDGTTWIVEYKNGATDSKKYRRDVLEWERLTYGHVHAYNQSATMQVNATYDYDTLYPDQNLQLMTTADLLFDERGFTEFGNPPALPTPEHWQVIVDKIDHVHAKGLCYMLENEIPGTNDDIAPAQRQWAMGNYLLVKSARKDGRNCDYMYMTGQQDYGYLVKSDDYKIAAGHPLGKRFATQGIWERKYSGGLALVNPSLSAARIRLPRGSWTDISGNPVGKTVKLAGQTALVLLKAN